MIPAVDDAIKALELETDKLQKEEERLMESLNHTIGSLSDLRYGRLQNAGLTEEVLESLEAFRETCQRKI